MRTRETELGRSGWLLLAVPATWTTLGVALSNPVGIPHVERLIVVALLLWLIGGLASKSLRLIGVPQRPAIYTTFLAMVLLTGGAGLVAQFGGVAAWAIVGGLVGLALIVFVRLEESRLVEALVVGLAIALISGPVIDFVGAWAGRGESTVRESVAPTFEFNSSQDVILILIDGHPGLRALELDVGTHAAEALTSRFESLDFEVPPSAWSAYWATDQSLPSLLDLGLPTEGNLGGSSLAHLYTMIGGDNNVVRLFSEAGYETVMLESGWSGSSCGPQFDECVSSPLLDEALFWVIERSMFAELAFQRFGYAFTVGTNATIDWLRLHTKDLTTDSTPTFVFAHLMAPHAPYLLDESCNVRPEPGRSGVEFNRNGVPVDRRSTYLAEQMACIQDAVAEIARLASDDAVLVVASDHGTDRRRQLSSDPMEWTEDGVTERMNVFVAVSGLSECEIGTPVFLPNLMRRVFSCLSGHAIEDISPTMYLGPDVRLAEDALSEIVGPND